MLTLSLEKPGVETPKLKLSLNKGAQFTVRVEWQCDADHSDDVDVHALEASNTGSGAKVTELSRVLSTYNTRLMNPSGGALPSNADGSFQTPSGGLSHSGDKRVQNNTETIVIDAPSADRSDLALVLAPLADVTVLVVAGQATEAAAPVALRDEIEAVGGTIAGVVVNRSTYQAPPLLRRLSA